MSPLIPLLCIASYFAILLIIAWITSRKANDFSYFLGNKASPWYIVAFGMISDSLSGVTFISVPGWVGSTQFSYLQLVFGYLAGYLVIAKILLPLYYKLNLTSIYTYLFQRFGRNAQKTGAFFFLASRTLGAAFRLYLATSVIQMFVFDHWGVPFWFTVSLAIALILVYTIRGGIRTLVWTDAVQSAFLLLGVVLSVIAIADRLDFDVAGIAGAVKSSRYSEIFFWDWTQKQFFPKYFLSGMFIAIVMTGLDQNMMQKNLSCRSLADAQRNIYWFSSVLVFVNILFLTLGALLYIYADALHIAIPPKSDDLFPMLAFNHLGLFASVVFIIGLTAATFSSADSVLTTLTTSFMIDFLNVNRSSEKFNEKPWLRYVIHLGFACLMLAVILVYRAINNEAVINAIFTIAGYTYGPLLGLFSFGLFSKINVHDRAVPFICILSPVVCYFLNEYSEIVLWGYRFGFELLLVNGIMTFCGLLAVAKITK